MDYFLVQHLYENDVRDWKRYPAESFAAERLLNEDRDLLPSGQIGTPGNITDKQPSGSTAVAGGIDKS